MERCLLSLGLFLVSAYIILQSALLYSERLEIIHLIIIAISCISLFSYETRPYSTFKSFHIFTLCFVGIAPLVQYKNMIVFWGAYPFSESDYFHASVIQLLAVIVFNAIYIHVSSQKQKIFIMDKILRFFQQRKHHSIVYCITTKQIFWIISLACIACVARLYQNNFNIMSLMFRGGEFKEHIDLAKSSGLLISSIFTPMNAFLFLYVWYKDRRRKMLLSFLFVATLFTAPPTGLARFSLAAIYIPIAMSVFKWMKKRNVFVLILSFGLITLFPLFSIFRAYNKNVKLKVGIDTSMFQSVDFDSYAIFMHILKHDIITYGKQALGVMFFWFPRSVWTDKPVGSGEYIAGELKFFFSNISCNYLGEGYINFGYMGVFAAIAFLAYVLAQIDNLYWRYLKFNSKNYFSVFYFSLLGLLFLVLRGDLLCSFAYVSGFMFVASFIYVMMSRLEKKCIRIEKSKK